MFLADGSPEVSNEAWKASHNVSFLWHFRHGHFNFNLGQLSSWLTLGSFPSDVTFPPPGPAYRNECCDQKAMKILLMIT